MKITLLACTMLISFACCKRNTDKTTTTTTGTSAVTVNGSPSDSTTPSTGTGSTGSDNSSGSENDMKGSNLYDFTVSFFSPGSGIDHTAKDSYDKFLEGYKSKVEVEQYRWGREGEIDYCLKLSKLSAAEKKEFIDKSKAILEKSDRVNYKENAECVHKK